MHELKFFVSFAVAQSEQFGDKELEFKRPSRHSSDRRWSTSSRMISRRNQNYQTHKRCHKGDVTLFKKRPQHTHLCFWSRSMDVDLLSLSNLRSTFIIPKSLYVARAAPVNKWVKPQASWAMVDSSVATKKINCLNESRGYMTSFISVRLFVLHFLLYILLEFWFIILPLPFGYL